jgi:proteasome accessory factor B
VERAERLLDLVALFLNAREPVSWAEIQEAFPEDYSRGSAEANIRKFERDKAELLELGIALVYLQGEEREKDGYQLDRSGYYLPDLKLKPDELAVLFAAGSAALSGAAFPFREDLIHALKKMAFAAGDDPGAGRDWSRMTAPHGGEAKDGQPTIGARLEPLSRGVAARKRVTLRYHTLQRGEVLKRDVDPYGLVYRFGTWVLVGYCHLRQAIRSFRVDRILDLELNEARPRSPDFELSAGFQLSEYAVARPWEFHRHKPLDVRLRLSPDMAWLAERTFAGSEVLERSGAGLILGVRVSDSEALLRAVLPLGEGAEILSPPELRQRAREVLRDLLQRHGGAREEPAVPRSRPPPGDSRKRVADR